ncbi:hypothetical protein GGR52DRAFT_574294 [Hypoxylon sp. FL1284]|nr:hypothetical protein GGR52DRAFT_574294 [Hypoxylon sp. FL1284]
MADPPNVKPPVDSSAKPRHHTAQSIRAAAAQVAAELAAEVAATRREGSEKRARIVLSSVGGEVAGVKSRLEQLWARLEAEKMRQQGSEASVALPAGNRDGDGAERAWQIDRQTLIRRVRDVVDELTEVLLRQFEAILIRAGDVLAAAEEHSDVEGKNGTITKAEIITAFMNNTPAIMTPKAQRGESRRSSTTTPQHHGIPPASSPVAAVARESPADGSEAPVSRTQPRPAHDTHAQSVAPANRLETDAAAVREAMQSSSESSPEGGISREWSDGDHQLWPQPRDPVGGEWLDLGDEGYDS